MSSVDDRSVDLVVTSPPYPMIAMWDAMFVEQDASIGDALDDGDGAGAFDRMHAVLRPVWAECVRVLKPGGLMCVNVGDATRSLGNTFQLYSNHARVVECITRLGLHALPGILWRKSTNKPNKFMGSGMIPPNAYVTLEHEHILIFRKHDKRTVAPSRRSDRYESAYFWEERNRWFSDVWTDLGGTRQRLDASTDAALRDRSAAFPLALPLRLIQMFSIAGDTVLDPFWGTGTTSVAAAMLRRHSIGYEVNAAFETPFVQQMDGLASLAHTYNEARIEQHRAFLRERDAPCKNHNDVYDFGVVTRDEQDVVLYGIDTVTPTGDGNYAMTYQPHGVHAPGAVSRARTNGADV